MQKHLTNPYFFGVGFIFRHPIGGTVDAGTRGLKPETPLGIA